MFDAEAVGQALPGRMVLWLGSTDSTMLDAARLASEGCPDGAVIGAEEQTRGQGRHGRSWHSEAGAGLYFSQVLRRDLAPDQLPVLTMALGLAVAESITMASSLACDLRWPNDVLIGGRKVAGILANQLQPRVIVSGIGINVNQTRFPAELEPVATSMRLASGGVRIYGREALLALLLPSIDRHIDLLAQEQGKAAILRLFSEASSYVRGRRVVVEQNGERLRGVTAGLDANGFLLLEGDNGKRTVILAGGVRPE